jgi:predicted transcriptional regulator
MRRGFDRSILPTEPPPKGERYAGVDKGSRFNTWFREKLEEAGVTNKRFAEITGEPYRTVMCWRKRSDPRFWGQCRIAEGLAELGIGEYEEIRKEIARLCRRDKRRI